MFYANLIQVPKSDYILSSVNPILSLEKGSGPRISIRICLI